MKLYIIWALEKRLSNFENIYTEVVFLDIGDSHEYNTTEDDLEEFKNLLNEKAKKLREYIEEKSGIDDFKKCKDKDICIKCGYKPYCDNS